MARWLFERHARQQEMAAEERLLCDVFWRWVLIARPRCTSGLRPQSARGLRARDGW
jgi:hypothetical protein